jgi:hypothetical protein
MQNDENFNQQLLDEMTKQKLDYYTFFQSNEEKFLFDKNLANDSSIEQFFTDI